MLKRSVLVVDDEPLARRGVSLRLKAHDDLKIIGECSNGREAEEFIREHKPDLVFLDIQMPVMNGIDVVRAVGHEVPSFFIFLTAFDEYVMRAFELHAIDYLLKPVDEARFEASLNHARRVLGSQMSSDYNRRLQELLGQGKAASQPVLREITIRVGSKVRFVPVAEIDWIEAQGDYAEIHLGAVTHLIRESLATLEERLDRTEFLRIHRSAIVRVHRIARVTSLPNRDCAVTLSNGTSLRVSRTYSDHLRKLLRNKTISDDLN